MDWAAEHTRRESSWMVSYEQPYMGKTLFQQPTRRKWIWKSPGEGRKNHIDFILISKRLRNALLAAKTRPGADCDSDHVPVAAKFNWNLRKP